MTDEPADKSKASGHEPISINVRPVIVGMAVLLATVVASLLLMAGLVAYFAHVWEGEPQVGPVEPRIAPPPGIPAVTADQPAMLRRLRAREAELLTEYAWIDRDAGVARIPIRRAMEIVAQQSTPTHEPTNDDSNAQ